MIKTIGFFTGARSDYGIMKNLIQEVKDSENFDYKLYISGLHLLEKFGYTFNEIQSDGFDSFSKLDVFDEDNEPGHLEFSKIINEFYNILKEDLPDAVFLLGDRFETYAAALACHFSGIPIIHSGGGTLTEGAVDNIYRYNISNLATYHFATSKGNYKRLMNLPISKNGNIYFTGSFAIDAIRSFLKRPMNISAFVSDLEKNSYCLITFHSATQSDENISEIMDNAVDKILDMGKKVLITYPNNDPGYKKIINVIEKWEYHPNVYIKEHLGAVGYYAALNDCLMVVGNSSSGIVEAPYFGKVILNIGTRQEGREADEGVISLKCDSDEVLNVIENFLNSELTEKPCNSIYGRGDSLIKIREILSDIFLS